MRKLFAAVVTIVLVFAVPAGAQEAKQDFKLVNKTGYELKALYVSPSKSDDWGDDILGEQVVGDGQVVNVHFSPKAHTCHWDLKVTYTDDDSNAVWGNIDLRTVEKITIFYDRKNDVAKATFD
jgi:hypothetical protein